MKEMGFNYCKAKAWIIFSDMIHPEADLSSLDMFIKTGPKSCRHFGRDSYSRKEHYFKAREVHAISPLQPNILVLSSGRTLRCTIALLSICYLKSRKRQNNFNFFLDARVSKLSCTVLAQSSHMGRE